LRDLGHFANRFDRDVLEADVLPWLIAETQNHVAEMGSVGQYPTTLIGNFVQSKSERHASKVKEYAEMIKARRASEMKGKEDKISEKLRKKAEKEAKRKNEQIAALKEQIQEKYVDKSITVDEILKQEIVDVDGWSQEGKPVVTALGGWFGQLMIVLNTVAKYYPQLDKPVKTGRSGNRASDRPKSQASGKSGNKSERSGKSQGATSEAPRQILNAQVVQNFIYTYVLEKMKVEKLSLLVDSRYEKFINALGQPLQLNEMRTLKQDKYDEMRQLLSNFMASPALRLIKDNQEKLELDPEVFDLVYEGFWDLYSFHPQIRDISARKLQTWIQKVKLTSGPDRSAPEDAAAEAEDAGDDEEEKNVDEKPKENTIPLEGEDVIDPISAIVRLKIPKVPREPEMDDDGNEIVVEVD
jgi:hypothetical protein